MKSIRFNTLRQLIRTRPVAVEVLENALGSRFWDSLDDDLEVFCARFSIQASDLLDRVAALPPVPSECDWDTQPLCHLIERLSVEHDGFRDRDLPGLRAVLGGGGLTGWPDRYVLELVPPHPTRRGIRPHDHRYSGEGPLREGLPCRGGAAANHPRSLGGLPDQAGAACAPRVRSALPAAGPA